MIEINGHKGQMLELKVSGENFYKDIDFIKKSLVGKKYNETTKLWQIPIIKLNFQILEKAKKHFADHDALWAFEAEDYANFMTVNKVGDVIQLSTYYDAELVNIIKEMKTKDDKWDKEKWNLTEATWKAIQKKVIAHLDKRGEKYEIKV